MQTQPRDPAAGIPRELLPHLHLVSKHRYPTMNQMALDTVLNHLSEATRIVHDLQPVVWQFLEPPPDGTVLLTWQPLEQLGTNFASDGYIWTDNEHAFSSEHHGFTVEMWIHRSGFQWPNEPLTAHSRRRYRLTQSKVPGASIDPALWLVHYSRSDREFVMPSNQVPLAPPVMAAMNQRRYLQSQGQPARKEFMLHDKANWPTLNLPAAQLQYPPHMIARQQARQQAQMQMGVSPSKGIPNQQRRGPSNVAEPTLEEEEDVSRGDLLDFMTPRDISKMRYEQHHEWMEEITASHFSMKQITPASLGLGRKGELETLTASFFDTPVSVLQDPSKAGAGRLDADKATEFTTRANAKINEMQADIARLQKLHASRKAQLGKISSLAAIEKRLRVSETTEQTNYDQLARSVETATGKKLVPISSFQCVQKGGLEERVPTPPPVTAPSIKSPPAAPIPQPAEPVQADTAPSLPTTTQTPPTATSQTPQPDTTEDQSNLDDMDLDIDMAGLDAEPASGLNLDADTNEWVMVDESNPNPAAEVSLTKPPQQPPATVATTNPTTNPEVPITAQPPSAPTATAPPTTTNSLSNSAPATILDDETDALIDFDGVISDPELEPTAPTEPVTALPVPDPGTTASTIPASTAPVTASLQATTLMTTTTAAAGEKVADANMETGMGDGDGAGEAGTEMDLPELGLGEGLEDLVDIGAEGVDVETVNVDVGDIHAGDDVDGDVDVGDVGEVDESAFGEAFGDGSGGGGVH